MMRLIYILSFDRVHVRTNCIFYTFGPLLLFLYVLKCNPYNFDNPSVPGKEYFLGPLLLYFLVFYGERALRINPQILEFQQLPQLHYQILVLPELQPV